MIMQSKPILLEFVILKHILEDVKSLYSVFILAFYPS